jgi:hypothetical protein
MVRPQIAQVDPHVLSGLGQGIPAHKQLPGAQHPWMLEQLVGEIRHLALPLKAIRTSAINEVGLQKADIVSPRSLPSIRSSL